MSTVAESLTGKSQLGSTLADGVDSISEYQQIVFKQYTRSILPIDGYAFWLLNQNSTFTADGSLHYATSIHQEEDSTQAINSVVFTSEVEINQLNNIDSQNLWIGTWQGQQFAFSARKSFYQQSGLFHYVGDAVYPTMLTQLIDSAAQLQAKSVIVSNSLPIWLGLSKIMPVYPSFLVPANAELPYASIHIEPQETKALQSIASQVPVFKYIPYVTSGYVTEGYVLDTLAIPLEIVSTESYQLTRDKVRVTIWGQRSQDAIGFLNYVIKHMTNCSDMGLLNMPIVRDDKVRQSELNIIGQKKVIDFEVSYQQQAAFLCAMQLIKSATVNLLIGA